MQTSTVALQNKLAVSREVKNALNTWSSNPTPRYLSNWNENSSLHKNLYINVYSGYIPNCQKLETTQMSVNGRAGKHTVVGSANTISNKKDWSTDICNNSDESQMYYTKMPKLEGCILSFHLYIILETAKLERQKTNPWSSLRDAEESSTKG